MLALHASSDKYDLKTSYFFTKKEENVIYLKKCRDLWYRKNGVDQLVSYQ